MTRIWAFEHEKEKNACRHFSDLNFEKCRWDECSFDGCEFSDVRFVRCCFSYSFFSQCKLTRCSFYKCVFSEFRFSDCEAEGLKFSECFFYDCGASFVECSGLWVYKTGFSGFDFGSDDATAKYRLKDVIFSTCDFDYVEFHDNVEFSNVSIENSPLFSVLDPFDCLQKRFHE